MDQGPFRRRPHIHFADSHDRFHDGHAEDDPYALRRSGSGQDDAGDAFGLWLHAGLHLQRIGSVLAHEQSGGDYSAVFDEPIWPDGSGQQLRPVE